MRNIAKLSLALVACFVLAAVSFAAQSPVGHWVGKLSVNLAAMSNMGGSKMTPQQRAQMMSMARAQIAKIRISLLIKKNGTYNVTSAGMPTATKSHGGHWKQVGNSLTLTSDQKGEKPQHAVLSTDGKTLTVPIPKNPGGPTGSVIFKRG